MMRMLLSSCGAQLFPRPPTREYFARHPRLSLFCAATSPTQSVGKHCQKRNVVEVLTRHALLLLLRVARERERGGAGTRRACVAPWSRKKISATAGWPNRARESVKVRCTDCSLLLSWVALQAHNNNDSSNCDLRSALDLEFWLGPREFCQSVSDEYIISCGDTRKYQRAQRA
jgi:hypothetical protein